MSNTLYSNLPEEMQNLAKNLNAYPFQFVSEIGFHSIRTAREIFLSDSKLIPDDDPLYPVLLTGRGKAYSLSGDQEKALSQFRLSRQAAVRICSEGRAIDDALAFSLFEYGSFMQKLQYRATAKDLFSQAKAVVSSPVLAQLIQYNLDLIGVLTSNTSDTADLHLILNELEGNHCIPTALLGKRILAIYDQRNMNTALDKTLKVVHQCIQSAKGLGYNYLPEVLELGVGMAFTQAGLYDDAAIKCLDLYNNANTHFVKALSLDGIAYCEFINKKYEASIDTCYRALALTEDHGMLTLSLGQTLFLGTMYAEYINQTPKAEYYYKKGFKIALEMLKKGFPCESRIAGALSAYPTFLDDYRETNSFEQLNYHESFASLLDCSWAEIKSLFIYNLFMHHRINVKTGEDFFDRLQINKRTYYSNIYKLKAEGFQFPDYRSKNIRIADSLLNSGLQRYFRHITDKTWAGARKQFENDVLQYLYEHYGYKKTVLARKLGISYQMLSLKTKHISR